MIVQENIKIDGLDLVRTYSDSGKYIIQGKTGVRYTEAIDIPNKYTYEESEEVIDGK